MEWWEWFIPGWNVYRGVQTVASGLDGTTGRREQARKELDSVKASAPGAYSSVYGGEIRSAQSELAGMGDFSYDYNTDAAYQQYKQRYTRGAKLASEDAQSTAAARSGGYANSWAATSGQNAYQSTMNGLAEVANDLYDQAYSEYNQKKTDLNNRIGSLQQQEALAQNQYSMNSANWNSQYSNAQSNYNNATQAEQQSQANAGNWFLGALGLIGTLLMFL